MPARPPSTRSVPGRTQLSCERKFDLMSGGSAVNYSPAGDMLAVGLDNGIVSLIKVWRRAALALSSSRARARTTRS